MPAPVPPHAPLPDCPPATESAQPGRAAAVAAALLATQALVLLALAGFYVVELLRGEGASTVQVVASGALILAFAVGLGLLVPHVWQGLGWARTGATVWEVLLVPVAVSMLQAEQAVLGWTVLAVALSTVGALVLSRPAAEV